MLLALVTMINNINSTLCKMNRNLYNQVSLIIVLSNIFYHLLELLIVIYIFFILFFYLVYIVKSCINLFKVEELIFTISIW